jgi:hypothetical protein
LNVLILVLSLGLVLQLHPPQLARVLFEVQPHILAEQHQEPQTFDVVGVLLVDGLVDLQRLLEVANPALAGGHHQFPLHLAGLDLARPLQVETGFLVKALLNVVDSQPHVGIQVHRQETVGLEIVMQGLLLVVFPEEDVSHSCQHSSVVG